MGRGEIILRAVAASRRARLRVSRSVWTPDTAFDLLRRARRGPDRSVQPPNVVRARRLSSRILGLVVALARFSL